MKHITWQGIGNGELFGKDERNKINMVNDLIKGGKKETNEK